MWCDVDSLSQYVIPRNKAPWLFLFGQVVVFQGDLVVFMSLLSGLLGVVPFHGTGGGETPASRAHAFPNAAALIAREITLEPPHCVSAVFTYLSTWGSARK